MHADALDDALDDQQDTGQLRPLDTRYMAPKLFLDAYSQAVTSGLDRRPVSTNALWSAVDQNKSRPLCCPSVAPVLDWSRSQSSYFGRRWLTDFATSLTKKAHKLGDQQPNELLRYPLLHHLRQERAPLVSPLLRETVRICGRSVARHHHLVTTPTTGSARAKGHSSIE
mmetsp:Transcript_50584/g.109983  ORF Transcript_50584/g.109983 Transcript_50584/m.109983 type:complete len:169 (+) Transcript_50584:343-849(+)